MACLQTPRAAPQATNIQWLLSFASSGTSKKTVNLSQNTNEFISKDVITFS